MNLLCRLQWQLLVHRKWARHAPHPPYSRKCDATKQRWMRYEVSSANPTGNPPKQSLPCDPSPQRPPQGVQRNMHNTKYRLPTKFSCRPVHALHQALLPRTAPRIAAPAIDAGNNELRTNSVELCQSKLAAPHPPLALCHF
eukprot:4240882-Amphidinium_carterae.1